MDSLESTNTSAGSREFDPDRPAQLASVARRLLTVSRAGSLATAVLGAVVLVGYAARAAAVVRLGPSLPPMYPNAALGFVAGGVGLRLAMCSPRWMRYVGGAAAGLMAAIGAASLVLHLAGARRTWLEAFWPQPPFVAATTPVGGRPAAETCLAFMTLGAGIVLVAMRAWPRVAQTLSLVALAVGFSALSGYLLGVDRAELGLSLAGSVGMALHTALGITALGVASLVANPGTGIVAQFTSGGPGGKIGRWLLAGAVLGPTLFTGFAVLARRAVDNQALLESILVVVHVGLLSIVVMIPASHLDRLSADASAAIRASRRREEAAVEQDTVIAAIADELFANPPAPPGWLVAIDRENATGELAGDTLQVLSDDDHILIALFDLAGHGNVAALHAYRFRREIEALWRHQVEPIDIMCQLNRTALELDTIATGVLIAIEGRSGLARAVIAGHCPPLHLANGRVDTWARTGALLGLDPNGYSEARHQLAPGDLLVIYTDGVIETRRGRGPELGEQRLIELAQSWAHDPSSLVRVCLDAAREHASTRLGDDALVLALQFRPPPG